MMNASSASHSTRALDDNELSPINQTGRFDHVNGARNGFSTSPRPSPASVSKVYNGAITSVLRAKLTRSQSDTKVTRRTIFDPFWKPKIEPTFATKADQMLPHSPAPHKEEGSLTIPDRFGASRKPDLHQFTPPINRKAVTGNHFVGIDALPEESQLLLPDLPSPLRRFTRDRSGNLRGGVYPLCEPHSILRGSSYCREYPANRGPNGRPSPSSLPSELFNLTKSKRSLRYVPKDSAGCEASSHSSSSSRERRVRFDPRITVTEFVDDAERPWFSEQELERFKYMATLAAQKYLKRNPELIDEYLRATKDPVTGTMRRKALFSLPAFGCVSDDDEVDDVAPSKKHILDLVFHEVKNILVVDRNKLILDLFRRSLQALFPGAIITTIDSGEEALRVFTMSRPATANGHARGFDIVVAEQSLNRPLPAVSAHPLQKPDIAGSPHWRMSGSPVKTRLHIKKFSMGIVPEQSTWQGMSGSELFRRIVEFEETCEAPSKGHEKVTEASTVLSLSWRSLLIGVSIKPDQDAAELLRSGADLVWGKPPPRMNEVLRDHLVSTLIVKRRGERTVKDGEH